MPGDQVFDALEEVLKVIDVHVIQGVLAKEARRTFALNVGDRRERFGTGREGIDKSIEGRAVVPFRVQADRTDRTDPLAHDFQSADRRHVLGKQRDHVGIELDPRGAQHAEDREHRGHRQGQPRAGKGERRDPANERLGAVEQPHCAPRALS